MGPVTFGFRRFRWLRRHLERSVQRLGTGFSSNASAARRAPRRGADLRYDLTISFEEAVFGCDKDIEVSRHETCSQCNGTGAEPGTTPVRCSQCNGTGEVRRVQQSFLGAFVNVSTCPACQGEGEVISTPCHVCKGKKQVRKARTIKVKIPPGVDSGTQIRLAGEGESGTNNGPQGNLYVVLNVKEHAYFHRDGNDIVLEVIINVAQAALGDEITIPTLHGEEKLVIPAGTQSGEVFTLRAKGVPYLRRSGRGDQKIMVRVATPTELTEQQRALLRELGSTLGKEIVPQMGKGFFDKVKDAFWRVIGSRVCTTSHLNSAVTDLLQRYGIDEWKLARGQLRDGRRGCRSCERGLQSLRAGRCCNGGHVSARERLSRGCAVRGPDQDLSERGRRRDTSAAEEAIWHLGRLYPIPDPIFEVLTEDDWANAWKKSYQPLRIGRHLVVVPSWCTFEPEPGDVLIELDPGMAFGTGLHPTHVAAWSLWRNTRLRAGGSGHGRRVGILSIAAANLGAYSVLAVEKDPLAAGSPPKISPSTASNES